MVNINETGNNAKVDATVSYLVEAMCPFCSTRHNLKDSDVWWRLKHVIERGAMDCIGFVIKCKECNLRFQIDQIKGVGRNG